MDRIDLDDPPCPVRLVRNPRARRFTLRLDPSGEGAVLTQPPGVPLAESRAFLIRHAGWLHKALAKQPKLTVVKDGAKIPVDGLARLIEVRPGPRRAPSLIGEALVLQGEAAIGPRISAWLKLRARDRLGPGVKGYAAQLGKTVSRIALRDTRTRWGSCSTTGTLSFSWRLAMAPIEVQDYVAAHEAAHLVEMNHSPAYWAVVDGLMPGWKKHRNWLKREGRSLHSFKFTDP